MTQAREIELVRNNAGVWRRERVTILRFTGRDAGSWLHAQTTNEVLGLSTGTGNLQALLDRQGRIQAYFSLHRWEDEYWALIDTVQVPAVRSRMETHLFLEEVHMEEVKGGAHVIASGPRAIPFLCSLCDVSAKEAAQSLPRQACSFAGVQMLGREVLVFASTECGEDAFVLVPDPATADRFAEEVSERAEDYGVALVSPGAIEALRIEGGVPLYGRDIDPGLVIAETPLEATAVSYGKGCYQGQEVVTRLKSYGSPKRALSGLKVSAECSWLPEPRTALLVGGKKVGEIRSHAYSPTLGAWLAFAYLDREHRTPGTRHHFDVEGAAGTFVAEVVLLPFYRGPSALEYAARLYEEALRKFNADLEDESEEAIHLLQEAILLHPGFEDAYETLGVILHRHHRVDEAIHFMQTLARLNPNCLMAHSNLSVFYVAKGMISEAETEKAKAGQLEMLQHLDTREAEKQALEERERIQKEAEERIEMFLEVLEIDPEDPVATMGLGGAFLQLEKYAEAIPHFETAIRAKGDYSVAYLNLGKCHEFLGKQEEAVRVYREGIAVASRKGDLMPLREMERRLRALEPSG